MTWPPLRWKEVQIPGSLVALQRLRDREGAEVKKHKSRHFRAPQRCQQIISIEIKINRVQSLLPPLEKKSGPQKTTRIQYRYIITLLLLGFPKAKPESCPGCLYCLASRLFVQSGGSEGPRRAARWAPGGCVAAGSDGSQPVYVCLPPPGMKRGQRGDWMLQYQQIGKDNHL